jgi:hypothetical protein
MDEFDDVPLTNDATLKEEFGETVVEIVADIEDGDVESARESIQEARDIALRMQDETLREESLGQLNEFDRQADDLESNS